MAAAAVQEPPPPAWKQEVPNCEAEVRRLFEAWYETQADLIYERDQTPWTAKVITLYQATAGLTDFSAIPLAGREVETIVRHSYKVQVSQDRLRALKKTGTLAEFVQSYEGKFLWSSFAETEERAAWKPYVPTVVDRICSVLCTTELKHVQETRQTDAVTQFLQAELGFQPWIDLRKNKKTDLEALLGAPEKKKRTKSEIIQLLHTDHGYVAGDSDQDGSPHRLPVGYFATQFEIKSSQVSGCVLKVDVAVRTPSEIWLIELKSASDEPNTNKRMKEEGERYGKAEVIMAEFGIAPHEWKVLVILSGYFTAKAMENFQRDKPNAACFWFDNEAFKKPLCNLLQKNE